MGYHRRFLFFVSWEKFGEIKEGVTICVTPLENFPADAGIDLTKR